LENLVYLWACEFQKAGHQVAVVAPGDSKLPAGIELISIGNMENEGAAYMRYKNRLQSGEFNAIFDHTWMWYSIQAQQEADHQLPIIHCWHSDPYGLGSAPPIQKPCILSFSNAQAELIGRRWNTMARVAYHGIDLDFYKPDPSVPRGNRYLFLARYTPEKGFLELAYLVKKCKASLDAYGDTNIVSNQEYVGRCFAEAQEPQVRVMPGIPRNETIRQFQTHKALLTWPNYVEIFGLTTIEAMACGCPVISKDSGAAKELIINGQTGFVVGTMEHAEELIKTDAVAKINPDDCRKRAEEFSIAKSAQHHLKIAEDVAKGYYW
jgi:glycosyltransferase involved in cell wall biosynthesis